MLRVLRLLRARVKQNSQLRQFLLSHYAKEGRFLLGLNKEQNAEKLPAFSFTALSDTEEVAQASKTVSILIQLNNKEVDNNDFLGFVHCCQIIEILKRDFKQTLGLDQKYFIEQQITVDYDATRNPFFEAEIVLTINGFDDEN